MPVIALLMNPTSGKGRAAKVGKKIMRLLNEKNIRHISFVSKWPENLDDFSEIWLVGGDGTINYYLNRYKNNQLPIALFPAGTGNDFANMLYGKLTIEQQVKKIIQSVPQLTDVATCNGIFYINSAGIGFDGEVLKSMQLIRKIGGKLGYLFTVVRKIFSFREYYFTIKGNTTIPAAKYLLVTVNNATTTGGGINITPHASVNDGKLDILLCGPLKIAKRLRYLPVIEKGKHTRLPFITYWQDDSITIEAEKRMFGQLDGELIEGSRFVFNCLAGWLPIKY